MQQKQSPVGILRITLENALITNYQSMMSNIDLYTVIKLGTKTYESTLKTGVDRESDILFNESFLFIINKSKVTMGRVLEFEMWDKFKIGKN